MRTYCTKTDIVRAAEILRSGGLVAVPTETVYGLAAIGLDAEAVEEIYRVKGRPETKPISLLVEGIESASSFCREVPEVARRLSAAFWPGPLTMILWKNDLVPSIVTAGGNTVGIRCPDHPLTLSLLRHIGLPLAAPSANPSGFPAPTDAESVLAYLDGKIPCILDGGTCAVGVASTILDLTSARLRIIRQGVLSAEVLSAAAGCEVISCE